MELWIRSQDKECLIKVNDIAIEQNMIIGYFDKDTEYEYLGQYKSKERALEILDEIQKILIGKRGLISTLDKDKIEFIPFENQSVVYEMPKE